MRWEGHVAGIIEINYINIFVTKSQRQRPRWKINVNVR